MDLLTAFFVYLLIWWVMLFTVLPLGVRRNEEAGKGFDAGAPVQTHLGKKLILNTALTALILAVIQGLIITGVIDWHGFFEGAAK